MSSPLVTDSSAAALIATSERPLVLAGNGVLRRRAAGEPVTQRVIDVGFRLIARESA